MKKAGILLLIVFTAFTIKAQEKQMDAQNSGSLLQAGISFGYYGYGYAGTRSGFSIPLSVSYEKYFSDYVSGGVFAGYAHYGYEGYNNYEYDWTFIDFGARASYHYIHFLNDALDMNIDTDKYDFYLAAMLIFESRSFNSTSDYYNDFYEDDFNVSLGTVAGFRYHLGDKFSLFFEAGRGTFGYGTFGVTTYF